MIRLTMPAIRDADFFRSILENLQAGVCFIDRDRRILLWSAGAERLTGYQRHEVVGHICREAVLAYCNEHGCNLCGTVCPLKTTLLDGKSKEANVYFCHKTGHRVQVHIWAVPIRDEHGSIVGMAGSFDVLRAGVARDRRQSTLAAHGCLDEATGIANQSFTLFHLRENLASFEEYHIPFGVMHLQMNRAAQFQATYGREAAAAMLDVMIEAARNTIRPTDILGRWSEEEFILIAVGCTNTGLTKVVERLHKVLDRIELSWWGDRLSVTTKIGYASANNGDTVELLLDRLRNPLRAAGAASHLQERSEG